MLELAGKCQPADRFAFQLTRLRDFFSTSTINCMGVKTDWQNSIEFLKDSKSEESILKFTGKPGTDEYSLEVTGVIEYGLDPKPATGRCQMFSSDDSAGRRDIACFVELKDGLGNRRANLVKFTIDDDLLRIDETKQFTGSCSFSPIAEIVLKEEVARVYQGYRSIEFLPAPSCDSATMIGGKSITFMNSGNPKSKLVFSGFAEADDANRILIKSVAIGEDIPKKVIAGACSGLRRMDGVLHTLCRAAFEEDGEIKAVVVEFPEPLQVND